MNHDDQNYFSKITSYAQYIKSIEHVYQHWGYQSTLLPLFDNEKHYTQHLQDKKHNYQRAFDGDDTLILRSDSTLFLSKILGTHLHPSSLPLRLYYSNSVVRSFHQHEIGHWQSGVELIGISSKAAEFEIISLLSDTVRTLLDEYRIHVGSSRLVRELLLHNKKKLSENKVSEIFTKIIQRDLRTLGKIVDSPILDCIFDIADFTEYPRWKKNITSIVGGRNKVLLDYRSYFEALQEIDTNHCLRCDLAELGTHRYYTDTVYTVYAPSLPSPLAHGGRYDTLLQKFGFAAPAIGFTVFPYLVVNALISSKKLPTSQKKTPFHALSTRKSIDKQALLRAYARLQKRVR